MKFCILANPGKYSVEEPLNRVVEWCARNQTEIFAAAELKKHFSEALSKAAATVVQTEAEAVKVADIVIAIGGDGTLLHTAHLLKSGSKPILGINTGKLGFMANVQPDFVEDALNHVIRKEYRLDHRSLLRCELPGGETHYALNEFLFTKKDTSSMITLQAEYDGEFINSYWADGLIVSTPTGSTAYNLSAGGPIVMPGTPVMLLTPINPHTLTTRPLVLPAERALRIFSDENSRNTLFSCDGKGVSVNNSLDVRITCSDYEIQIIQLPEQNYFETLRNKLMWGLDRRKT